MLSVCVQHGGKYIKVRSQGSLGCVYESAGSLHHACLMTPFISDPGGHVCVRLCASVCVCMREGCAV